MSKKFGFELLREQFLDRHLASFDSLLGRGDCESEIKRLFLMSLITYVDSGMAIVYRAVLIPKDVDVENKMLTDWPAGAPERQDEIIICRPQAQIGNRRVDFLIHAWSPDKNNWRKLIVECDGHEYHERTKQQAARDRSRDRLAVVEGYDCFRFTGSELWRDPWGCSEEVVDWVLKGY